MKKTLCLLMAITMIIIGESIPALTAASPKTNPPTKLIVEPRGEGTLIPASRINSKDNSIRINSTIC